MKRKRIKIKSRKTKRHSRKRIVFFRTNGRSSQFATSTVALGAAQEVTNSDNIKVQKHNIPAKLVKYVERNVGVKFKKKPTLYSYYPKRGKRLRHKKECGGWDGVSITGFNKSTGKVHNTVIVIPESHLKDKKLKENVITHELAETLVGQHMIHPYKHRSRHQVDNFEHAFGMAYEKKHLDKHKMNRQQMSALAKKLWNQHMTRTRNT